MKRALTAVERFLRAGSPPATAPARNRLDVGYSLILVPVALVGLVWLLSVTDWQIYIEQWLPLSVMFLLMLLLQRFQFSLYTELPSGLISGSTGSLSAVIDWSAVLLFGPSALWMALVVNTVDVLLFVRRAPRLIGLWSALRNIVLVWVSDGLIALLAITLYTRLGGTFPLGGFEMATFRPAFWATMVLLLLTFLLYLVPFLYWLRGSGRASWARDAVRFGYLRHMGIFLGWPFLVVPFGIFAAALYSEHGLPPYVAFGMAMLFSSVLAHQLGRSAERSAQRSRELARLEQLGRDLLGAPLDGSQLDEIVAKYAPLMFPSSFIEIRLFPDRTLLHRPEIEPALPEAVWEWIRRTDDAHAFAPGQTLPWGGRKEQQTLVLVPITDVERHEPIGGIYLAARRWGLGPAEELVTAAQTLAAQIASAVHSTHVYERTLAHQRVEQELALAGAIQSSFLPRDMPSVPGWELAVWFVPARQTSGDFFDWIALPDGRLGLVVADVADKGMGAALYMALSRTLLRTYAVEHAGRPDLALAAANRRILSDTSSTMFVTVFFGVLDPETGLFIYANAGHNPPYLFNGGEPQPLPATGIPLGLFERTWRCESLVLQPGDALLLYTDGVTDAEHTERGFFEIDRLLDAAQSAPRGSAHAMREAIEQAVHDWIGESPPHDDITLLILTRAAD